MKKLINKTTVLILFLLLTTFLSAQNKIYYVDAVTGNDMDDGESTSEAWQTINKINNMTFQAGDEIKFKRGQMWRGQISITESGTSNTSRIIVDAYGTGNLPVINGSSLITAWTSNGGGHVWYATPGSKPRQVFFSGTRGREVTMLSLVSAANRWYWDAGTSRLYVYSIGNPSQAYTSPGMEVSLSGNGINITGDFITIQNIQVERTFNEAINISGGADNVIIEQCNFFQWTDQIYWAKAGILIAGSNAIVRSNDFGKKAGNDNFDRNWAGAQGIYISGANAEVYSNNLYHSAWEEDTSWSKYCNGIRVGAPNVIVSGVTKIHNNYIYHVGSCGIIFEAFSNSGTEFWAYENDIEGVGQAGISAYKTRAEDGTGGTGYVYDNNVTYADRIGWNLTGTSWWGGPALTGTASSGIHFNDGIQTGTEANKPFIKWYCYGNTVNNTGKTGDLNSKDSDGIAIDFNANNVEVFRNLVSNSVGKGMYIYNADNCKVYYNIIYGNTAGITISHAGSPETAIDNEIYNNTFYRNDYNNTHSNNTALKAEIYFGQRDDGTKIKNNIMYKPSASDRYCIKFVNNSPGTYEISNNLYYAVSGNVCNYQGSGMSLATWKTQTLAQAQNWDVNSIEADPLFTNAASYDFSLQSGSPAINSGIQLGLTEDYAENSIINSPDIGALESDYDQSVILIDAYPGGIFSGDGHHGTMTGMHSTKAIYFSGPAGGVTYNVTIPATGYWYAWARMYYIGDSLKNSFWLNWNSAQYILGDDDNKYDQWHWDGYGGEGINLGLLTGSTSYTLKISGREPGLCLWVDQIVITNDANYDPAVLGKEVDVEEQAANSALPTEYEVYQNYPNPFNPTTSIKFAIPQDAHVTLKVYDILGNEVANLVNSVYPAGYHDVKFDASSLASGIYIYRLNAGQFNRTMKMMLLK